MDDQHNAPDPPRGVHSRHVPLSVAKWIMDHVKCVRVGGSVLCEECGREYYSHPEVYPSFHLLCDGKLGKT